VDDNWSEPEIVRGLQQGNSDAWAALCNQYSERLWGHVSRLIGSNEAAVADVFQETLLTVAKAGRALHTGSRLWAWLATIGHKKCALYWRERARSKTEALLDDTTSQEPTDQLIQRENVIAVRLILADMSADYVTVLTAMYAEGMTTTEISEQLGQNTEAVRSRLARARRDFRQRYESLEQPVQKEL